MRHRSGTNMPWLTALLVCLLASIVSRLAVSAPAAPGATARVRGASSSDLLIHADQSWFTRTSLQWRSRGLGWTAAAAKVVLVDVDDLNLMVHMVERDGIV